MSGREAFEETMRALGFDHPDREYLGAMMQIAWAVWQARDAEIAAKDARIEQLERALQKLKELPRCTMTDDRWGHTWVVEEFGEWIDADEVHHIIEEALR